MRESLATTSAETASGIDALRRSLRELDAVCAGTVTHGRLAGSSDVAARLGSANASPLQVNAIATFSGTLGEPVLADVARLASLMRANARPRTLADYRAKFYERYEGDSRRVPLLELTDPDIGIGAPHDSMDAPEQPDLARDGLRMTLIAQALRKRTRNVTIDSQQLLALQGSQAVRDRAFLTADSRSVFR